jgi:hypothetical protein
MGYRSTQKGPWTLILVGVSILLIPPACLLREKPLVSVVLVTAAAALAVLGFCFQTMTVRDEGDRLGIRFGPLPLFRKTIPYTAVRSVETGRSSLVDGWGIHCILWRGWTYNIGGFSCVVLDVDGTVYRIGVPNPEALADFLGSRMVSRRA